MNRRMVYTGALPQDLDLNQNMQFGMIGLGYLAEVVMGQSTWAYGFTPAATIPASLTVNFGRGSLGMMTVVDQTNPGSSNIADTTDPLMKVGINLGATPIAFTPPGTSGQSQVFLIQGQMQEADTGSAVLPYYNAANPAQPFSGPNNSGAADNTIRAQTVALQVVAGTPATTGSQVAPSVTAGWVPLYLVTLANGQTTITDADVSVHPSAPFLPAVLPDVVNPSDFKRVNSSFDVGSYSFPDGTVLQFFTELVPVGSPVTTTFNFPTAFPHTCMTCIGITGGNTPGGAAGLWATQPISASQFTVTTNYPGQSGNMGIVIWALGY